MIDMFFLLFLGWKIFVGVVLFWKYSIFICLCNVEVRYIVLGEIVGLRICGF